MTFGLSDETPLEGNFMCLGTEQSLSTCLGYALANATSLECLTGMFQAGVRCIQGIHILRETLYELINTIFIIQCLHQLHFALMDKFLL